MQKEKKLDLAFKFLGANRRTIGKFIAFVLSLFLFLFALNLMSDAFKHIGNDSFKSIIIAASNPYIGLFTGLIITALIQSSSTTTTMVVTAVATGSITLTNAIPMIIGANIGTTITSLLVSISFIGKQNEFKNALSVGSAHNFFNVFIVLLLFPLEVKYGILTRSANYMTSLIYGDALTTNGDGAGAVIELMNVTQLSTTFPSLFGSGFFTLIISFLLLFLSIKIISKLIYQLIIGDAESKFQNYFFKNTSKSFFWGTLLTAGIQSSSITTSLVVPFVASSKITINRAIPFILGANIGTTITAFIVVMFKSQTATNIAMAHLLFNVFGVLFFLSSPVLRQLLALFSNWFGEIASKYRITIFLYLLLIFFVVPFLLIFLNQ